MSGWQRVVAYRNRAEGLRLMGEQFADAETRTILARIAADYEKMAACVERMAKARNPAALKA